MGRGRLEAFSDGVIAIIITIMVLELKAPHEATAQALAAQAPVFLSYALSFQVVAIMWVNHHHLLHAVRAMDAPLLWWNNALLFAMSLTAGLYASAVPLAYVSIWIFGIYLLIPALYFMPEPKLEAAS